nr:uncharacterized protein LOC109177106 [Ipomoea trifida]
MDKSGWDLELLEDLFVHQDVALIKSIPIAEHKQEDKLIWIHEDQGNYSVKSCYKKLQGSFTSQQVPFWTKVWRMHLPPKIKAFLWQLFSKSLPTVDQLRARRV